MNDFLTVHSPGDVVITCEKHGYSKPGRCPWCRVDELEIENNRLSNRLQQFVHQAKLPGFDDTARGYVGTPHAKTSTSVDGAKLIRPRADSIRRQIWELMYSAGDHGLTPFEAAAELGLATNTAGPRFPELRAMGKAMKTDLTRETYNGGQSRVHVAIGEGYE